MLGCSYLLLAKLDRSWIEAGSKLSFQGIRACFHRVSASQVIEEIRQLPPAEQAEVTQFAYRLDAERMLSRQELVVSAKNGRRGGPR
ncbi:MAG TPA: hypothetical protein DCE44_12205 [Verrucomicrobiales bacterium]|nr:hypothetical protein [Verrucomicrobiales bacterium]